MNVLPDKPTIFFDIDDTLILYDRIQDDTPERDIVTVDGTRFLKATNHIALLKDHKELDEYVIVVWSQGGSQWAEKVVRALELQDYVDIVVNKPYLFYDDLQPSYFMGKRVYEPLRKTP
mgnify:CR=1 FL=1